MRYYHYGDSQQDTHSMEITDSFHRSLDKQGELIVEADTIYEIDRDCMNCKAKKEKENSSLSQKRVR